MEFHSIENFYNKIALLYHLQYSAFEHSVNDKCNILFVKYEVIYNRFSIY